MNSAANECLRALGNLKSPEKYNSKNLTLEHRSDPPDRTKNVDYPYLVDAIDDKLLEKNGFKINKIHNNCSYFQIDPLNSKSNTRPSIGFGIHNGKVTKFGISPKTKESTQASDACQRWAGEKCVNTAAQSYNKFFKYMATYKYAREICELRFRKKLTKTPLSKTSIRWNAAEDQDCNNKQPVQNSIISYKKKLLAKKVQ